MKEKIGEILKIVSYILISIITFVIIFPIPQNKIILTILTILFLITQAFINRKKIVDFYIKPSFMYIGYLWIVIHIIGSFFSKIPGISIINNIACLFVITFYLYMLKSEDKNFWKIVFITSMITILIVNCNTIIQLNINPHLSRIISGSRPDLEPVGVGNYSYMYGLNFIVFALLGQLFSKETDKRIKIVICIVLLTSLIAIVKAKFVISYILLVIGILMMLFKINNTKRVLIFILTFVIIFFILSQPIGMLCKNIAKNTKDDIIRSRLHEVGTFLTTYSIEKTEDLKIRSEVYGYSIKAFSKSPIWGMIFGYKNGVYAGGHSSFLDEIARFGILFSSPFFILLYQILKRIYQSIHDEKRKGIFFVSIVNFIILGIINTIMFVPLLWSVFVIMPIINKLIINNKSEEIKGEKEVENIMDS